MSAPPAGPAPVSAEDILARDDLVYAEVWVPEWQATITIRTLTIDELEQLVKDSTVPVPKAPGTFRRDATLADQGLFQLGVVRPAFTPAQVKQLWTHSNVPIGRVLAALNRLNRTTDSDEAEVGAAVREFPAEPAEAPAV